VLAYKFLGEDGGGRFSNTRWPRPEAGQPGGWVTAGGPLDVCRRGVHACRAEALPLWIDAQLWAAELEGELLDAGTVLVAERGRLVRRLGAWDGELRLRFAEACVAHAEERIAGAADERAASYLADARRIAGSAAAPISAAGTSYVAARAVDAVEPGAYAGERAWQADWLARRLPLTA
jgi:hypothetical protein